MDSNASPHAASSRKRVKMNEHPTPGVHAPAQAPSARAGRDERFFFGLELAIGASRAASRSDDARAVATPAARRFASGHATVRFSRSPRVARLTGLSRSLYETRERSSFSARQSRARAAMRPAFAGAAPETSCASCRLGVRDAEGVRALGEEDFVALGDSKAKARERVLDVSATFADARGSARALEASSSNGVSGWSGRGWVPFGLGGYWTEDDYADEAEDVSAPTVVDVVPRSDRERRIDVEVEQLDTSMKIEDAPVRRAVDSAARVDEGRGGARRRSASGETAAEVARHALKTTARGARVTRKFMENILARCASTARSGTRVLRVAMDENNRERAKTNAQRVGSFILEAVRGITVQPSPVIRGRIEVYHVHAVFGRVARTLVKPFTSLGGGRKRRSRRFMSRESAVVDIDMADARPSAVESPVVNMRDLLTLFDEVEEEAVEDEVHPEDFAELLSPQSIRPDFTADSTQVLAVESAPTPQTVEISTVALDVSRGVSEGYGASLSEDEDERGMFGSPAFRSPASSSGKFVLDVAMSPDPEAQAFVRRIEDDIGKLPRSSSDERVSERILSREDVTLGVRAFREWFALSMAKRQTPQKVEESPIVIIPETIHSADFYPRRFQREMRPSSLNDEFVRVVSMENEGDEVYLPEVDGNTTLAQSVLADSRQALVAHALERSLEEETVSSAVASEVEDVENNAEARSNVDDGYGEAIRLLNQQVERLKEEQMAMVKSIELELERVALEGRKTETTSTQTTELIQLRGEVERLKSEQAALKERSDRRERDLKKQIELERKQFEKTLKASLAAERIDLEEEIAKSIVAERGGLEEQVHRGDEYLDAEIQQIHEELSRVKAEQERVLRASDGSENAPNPALLATPGSPIFALDTEADVSMEWDVYQLREDLERLKSQQSTVLALTERKEEDIRLSLSLEKESIEDTIRREVLRAMSQIEMQSVNATNQVQVRAVQVEKLLGEAESLMRQTENRLKERERELMSNAEVFVLQAEDRLKQRERELQALAIEPLSVSPFKALSPTTSGLLPSSTDAYGVALERARSRRRLLHEVTDTFSLSEIVTQARKLAADLEQHGYGSA